MKLKNKYLIALDLDGTLLNNKKNISYLTLSYLKKLAKHGNIVILSSGRPIRALIGYYKQLKLKTPIICYNGARILDPNDSSFPTTNMSFDKDMVKNIIDSIGKDIVISSMCETDDEIWVSEKDEFLFLFFWTKNMSLKVGNMSAILDKNPLTCIIKYVDTPENVEKIKSVVNKYDGISVRFWQSSNYCELYYVSINKAKAVKQIAQYYNIEPDNIYTFGDADNDYELITEFKNGVAMVNSKKQLKSAAKFVTKKDNNHNGIAHFLKNQLK